MVTGIEVIPVVAGIVCAVAAAKGLSPGKKNDRSRAGHDHWDDRYYRPGTHTRRSRARGGSSGRSSRALSLSRDTPHSIAVRWDSQSQSQWFNSGSERIRSKTPRSRRSSPRRRYRSSSRDGKRPKRRNHESLHGDDRARRLTMPLPYDEAPPLEFCDGKVERKQSRTPDGSRVREMYVCNGCNLGFEEPRIAPWHRFSPRDQGEVALHKNFILRSHEARDGKFGCILCHRWMTGFKSMVFHLSDHRYADLENVVPDSEWKGSEDWVL